MQDAKEGKRLRDCRLGFYESPDKERKISILSGFPRKKKMRPKKKKK